MAKAGKGDDQGGIRQEAREHRQGRRVRAADRRRVPGLPRRRAGGLHLRRARQGHHRAPGLPQHRAHGGAAVRRAARRERNATLLMPTETGNGGETHRLFPRAGQRRRSHRRPRRHRRMGEAHLRLDGPLARLQGGVPGHARGERRFLRALPGRMRSAGTSSARSACRSSTTRIIHPPVDRDRPPDEVGRRVRARREGDRRGIVVSRRQGGGDRLGADALQLRRPPRPDPGAGQDVRRGLHGADEHARREADLPAVLRDDRRR